jgi:hypothetical protein
MTLNVVVLALTRLVMGKEMPVKEPRATTGFAAASVASRTKGASEASRSMPVTRIRRERRRNSDGHRATGRIASLHISQDIAREASVEPLVPALLVATQSLTFIHQIRGSRKADDSMYRARYGVIKITRSYTWHGSTRC